MPDEPLLTVRELGEKLSLPESTVRYYRDAFLAHVPAVGMGRRRRYPPAALAVLRSIAQGYAEGLSREAILARLDGHSGEQPPAGRTRGRAPSFDDELEEEISNLDLLAAIVDGEREQREALWQMAREVVRITGVLETQDAALAEIGQRAGLALGPGEPSVRPALGGGALEPPAARGPAADGRPALPLQPWRGETGLRSASAAAAEPGHVPPAAGSHGIDAAELARLRQELDAERQLVDRLREARLRLEQRAVEAEGAIAKRRGGWRDSVLGRLLGTDGPTP